MSAAYVANQAVVSGELNNADMADKRRPASPPGS